MERLHDQGRELPKDFYERPDIARHLTGLWLAFGELSTERPGGMGMFPIPVSKIKAYLRDEFGLEGEEHERALAILRAVDASYLSMANGQREQEDDKQESVKVTDTVGVKKMMRRLGKKKREPRKK